MEGRAQGSNSGDGLPVGGQGERVGPLLVLALREPPLHSVRVAPRGPCDMTPLVSSGVARTTSGEIRCRRGARTEAWRSSFKVW